MSEILGAKFFKIECFRSTIKRCMRLKDFLPHASHKSI